MPTTSAGQEDTLVGCDDTRIGGKERKHVIITHDTEHQFHSQARLQD